MDTVWNLNSIQGKRLYPIQFKIRLSMIFHIYLTLVILYFETTGLIPLLVEQWYPRVFTNPVVRLVWHEIYQTMFYRNLLHLIKFLNTENMERPWKVLHLVWVPAVGFGFPFRIVWIWVLLLLYLNIWLPMFRF